MADANDDNGEDAEYADAPTLDAFAEILLRAIRRRCAEPEGIEDARSVADS
jgi:hypothetical protein